MLKKKGSKSMDVGYKIRLGLVHMALKRTRCKVGKGYVASRWTETSSVFLKIESKMFTCRGWSDSSWRVCRALKALRLSALGQRRFQVNGLEQMCCCMEQAETDLWRSRQRRGFRPLMSFVGWLCYPLGPEITFLAPEAGRDRHGAWVVYDIQECIEMPEGKDFVSF